MESLTARQLCPNSMPAKIKMKFQIKALIVDKTVVFHKDNLDIPAKKDITARVPDKNLLATIIQYPYLRNHSSGFWRDSGVEN